MSSGYANSQGQTPPDTTHTRCLSPETNTRPGRAPPSRSEDSWVELSSQPSSSSLSSAAATEEIVTTGLKVQQHRHRRGFRQAVAPQNLDIVYPNRPSHTNESSQDEYEETESESDHVLSSSNEDLKRRPPPDIPYATGNSSASDVALSSDDDDNLTALGLQNPPAFKPQPNAFSHPPAAQSTARSRTTAVSSRGDRGGTRRNSRSSVHSARRQRQHQHSPYNMISPSHHVDHDAALRASLSTLLSCAAAARGLPKRDSPPSNHQRPAGNRTAEPSAFRLVPESAMDDEVTDKNKTAEPARYRQTPPPTSKRSRSPLSTPHKARRKEMSKDRSTAPPAKKARGVVCPETNNSIISPTVMTWVISAGVVVLFSAISFSAGYVLGREVGRTEAGQAIYSGGVGDGISGLRSDSGCGKEAVKGGLRRFRWVGGGSGSGISA